MEKIWLESYPPDVKDEISLATYPSLSAMFTESVKNYGVKPAYHNMGKTLSYTEAGQLVDDFSSYLRYHLKLKKGQRVAVMMPNLLQYPVAVFGILQAELTVVNINPLYTPRELEHQLIDSGATTIIILENYAHVLAEVIEKTAIKNVITTTVGDLLGPKGTLINFAVRHLKKLVPAYQLPNDLKFKEILKQGKSLLKVEPTLTHEDVAFLQYTSATTGVAKGAVLTHGNIVANMLQVSEWIKGDIRKGGEVVVAALPLYHIFSLTANLMTFTMFGALNILITNPRELDDFVKTLRKFPISILIGVNTLFNGLLNHNQFSSLDFNSWRFGFAGGMAVQKVVADKWQEVTGKPLIEAYGLTETSPAVCMNPLNEQNRVGSIGLPIPHTDISIRNALGQEVSLGEKGELWIKGPQVMTHYWQRPQATAEAFDKQGFFATGDIATVSPDGFVNLVDRKKDMILVSGFNVYPNEVEDVMVAHPDILEVACIGVPDKKTGEAVKLVVVPHGQEPAKKDLIAFAQKHLTAYKVPKKIDFTTELPKNNVGKILRRELREVPAKKES